MARVKILLSGQPWPKGSVVEVNDKHLPYLESNGIAEVTKDKLKLIEEVTEETEEGKKAEGKTA